MYDLSDKSLDELLSFVAEPNSAASQAVEFELIKRSVAAQASAANWMKYSVVAIAAAMVANVLVEFLQ